MWEVLFLNLDFHILAEVHVTSRRLSWEMSGYKFEAEKMIILFHFLYYTKPALTKHNVSML
jgi:hypothetical protein